MTVHIDVWSDFVCPFCYAVNFSLEKLKQSHDIEIRWRSYELRPQGSPPVPADHKAYIENVAHPRFQAMMREQHGIEIKSGSFGINSRPALIGAKYAEAQGVGEAYQDTVKRLYWLEGRNIEDLDVLKEIATAVGLDAEAYTAALKEPSYEALVDADIAQAREFGLSGVPALVFENKYLVSGAQPYEHLAEVVNSIEAEREATS